MTSRAQWGATLVDVMAGMVVALLAMVVVYQSLVLVQAMRRNTAAAADMDANGRLALSVLATQIANAGAGLASASRWLDSCPATPDMATTLRPIHVLISDAGAVDRADTVFVRQSFARSSPAPLPFIGDALPGSNFRVGGIGDISTGDRVALLSRTGICLSSIVTNVTVGGPGVLDVAHTPVTVMLPVTSLLLNLGQAARPATTRFDVVSRTLRSTDVTNGDAPNPLLSNLAHLKFQYGIDNDGDGTLDTWVTAAAGTPWDAATLLSAPRSTLERIKAVRIGLIARTEQRERGQTAAYHWVLFDCELDDKSACPGRITGTIPAPAGGGYRYRTFETIVPLRNVLWNAGA